MRCRKCSAIISVPGESDDDVLFADDLEHIDVAPGHGHGHGGVGAARRGRPAVDLVDPDLLFEQASQEFEPDRSNALYKFPFSHQIDRWLPVVIVVPCAIWLVSQTVTGVDARRMPGWATAVRLLMLTLGFAMFVLPTTYVAVRNASVRLRFRLPPPALWRVAAVFMLPYALGCAMWLIDGKRADLILGCVVGLVLALPALWLLLRLKPEEGPLTLGLGAGAFAASMTLAALAATLFGLLVNKSLKPDSRPTTFAENPLGPGLRWDLPSKRVAVVPPKRRVPVESSPPLAQPATQGTDAPSDNVAPGASTTRNAVTTAPAVTDPPNPTGTTTPPLPTPTGDDPLFGGSGDGETSGTAAALPIVMEWRDAIEGQFDEIVVPPGPVSWVGVLRRGQTDAVTRWSADTWKSGGEATFSQGHTEYHLSTDGSLLARVSRFPNLSVQTWSYTANQFLTSAPLDSKHGQPTLLGFCDAEQLLVHWRSRDGGSSLELLNVRSGLWSRRIVKMGPLVPSPEDHVISGDGQMIAFLSRVPGAEAIEVHSLGREDRIMRQIPVTQLNWNVDNRVRGIALSADRRYVAMMVESEGQGLLLAWDIVTGKLVREHLYPAGLEPAGSNLFRGRALTYVGEGKVWLIYGNALYDVATGRPLGTLGVKSPMRQWVAGYTCYVTRAQPDGSRVLSVLRLNMKTLETLSARQKN